MRKNETLRFRSMVEPPLAAQTATARANESREAQQHRTSGGSSHRRSSVTRMGPGSATLLHLQALADASPRVVQLQRLQTLADGAGPDLTQRKSPEEEELLQGQFASGHGSPSQRQADSSPVPPAAATNRTGLPDGLKSGIEALSGLAMDHVRVHYNSAKPAQLNAHAYAQGSEIHLAPGQDRHLPHEAWHLVQQAQGRVPPTLLLNGGVAVNDDPSLEHEADRMGERALASGG